MNFKVIMVVFLVELKQLQLAADCNFGFLGWRIFKKKLESFAALVFLGQSI